LQTLQPGQAGSQRSNGASGIQDEDAESDEKDGDGDDTSAGAGALTNSVHVSNVEMFSPYRA
jgi:hypothetical protein